MESGRKKEPLLISACLIGQNVRYDGKNCFIGDDVLHRLQEKYELIAFCPEAAGGLACPRAAAEIIGASEPRQVLTINHRNVTKNFDFGADKALNLCKDNKIRSALLKDKSPSCGVKHIYDGSFSGKLIAGKGITAQLLSQNGIRLFSEKEAGLL
jgi:uncharacterized protein YbbK (DUF523 family)